MLDGSGADIDNIDSACGGYIAFTQFIIKLKAVEAFVPWLRNCHNGVVTTERQASEVASTERNRFKASCIAAYVAEVSRP